VTFAFRGGPNITTWGHDAEGRQVWRARWGADTFVEFAAPRDIEPSDLLQLAKAVRPS